MALSDPAHCSQLPYNGVSWPLGGAEEGGQMGNNAIGTRVEEGLLPFMGPT